MKFITFIKEMVKISMICVWSHLVFAQGFTVSSPDMVNARFTQMFVSNQFGCHGQNISPNISWVHAPKETKSFLVTLYDPDAPTGSGWWHWVVANIPANEHELKQGVGNDVNLLPKGSIAIHNDFGHHLYGGPCPPKDSEHRYQMTVYALNIDKIDIPKNATAAYIGFMAHLNMLSSATVTYYYKNQ